MRKKSRVSTGDSQTSIHPRVIISRRRERERRERDREERESIDRH